MTRVAIVCSLLLAAACTSKNNDPEDAGTCTQNCSVADGGTHDGGLSSGSSGSSSRNSSSAALSSSHASGSGSSSGNVGAPTVGTTVPSNAAMGVAQNITITAMLNRAVAVASVTPTTFVLRQAGQVVAAAVTGSGRTVTLQPSALLTLDTAYTVTLTTGITDSAGIALASDVTWTFTTVAENSAPVVRATRPANAAINVWNGEHPVATFNKAMNAATLTNSTFTLMQGLTPVEGSVTYDAALATATFIPAAVLGDSLLYTASISTGAQTPSGRSLAAPFTWSFTTHSAQAGALPVNLGTAGNYVILAETMISTVPTSAVTGAVAISPAAATFITGFSLTMDSTNVFSTSPQVTGHVFAANYSNPTPSNLTIAVGDMGTAFTDAAGRAPDVTELGAGNIGGMTLAPGVYQWGTGLLIPTDVHLSGSATDVWIFQVAQDLTVSSGAAVSLSGGALPKNVFWQVSGLIQLGTTAHMEGVMLSQTAITLATGASVNGRLLAQSAVTLDSSTVVQPAP